jgi:hydrogenase nickel incorporation protein HypB
MPVRTIQVTQKILASNDSIAAINRQLLDDAGVFSINLISSPGSGKTSLVEATVRALKSRFQIGMINGDTAPATLDADRAERAGAQAVHINTAGRCHLEAGMIGLALESLPLDQLDLVIVENVGNLVCPSHWQLGAHATVLIASTPEGADKPFKYPGSYRGIGAVVLNKTDLLPYLDFDQDLFWRGVAELNPGVKKFPLSCVTKDGLDAWLEWIATGIAGARLPNPLQGTLHKTAGAHQ